MKSSIPFGLLLTCVAAHAQGPRQEINFNRGWQFARLQSFGQETQAKARHQKDWKSQYSIEKVTVSAESYDLNGPALERQKLREIQSIGSWRPVTLPDGACDPKLGSNDPWRGVCYYRRTLFAPRRWATKNEILTLGAAMQVSDVWLNGKHVGGRRGGYLPVVIDLTGRLHLGQANQLLVRLDNRDNPLVPPGKPLKDLDFRYFGGLYRGAYLTVTNKLFITDPILENKPRRGGIYVSFPKVNRDLASVDVRTDLDNKSARPSQVQVRQALLDQKGHLVAFASMNASLRPEEDRQSVQEFRFRKPHLWTPDSPYLYRLRTSVFKGKRMVDEITTPVGIRSIRFSREEGLVLNGRPFRLVGTNRHQEFPLIGNAASDNDQYRDFVEIKNGGFNLVRLSHYPQPPSVLGACDRLGIFVIDCIPGWQFYNTDPRFTARVKQDIRDTIRRDRNHPCVMAWEMSLNETYPPKEIANEWHKTAHEEFIGPNFCTAGDALTGANWDLPYNSWDEATKSRPQDAIPRKPGYIREYGDYEFGGGDSTSRVSRGDGEKKNLQAAWNFIWSHNRYRAQYPWTIGDGTWVMYDYTRGYDPRPEMSGMADQFRIPRYTYYFFQSQRDPSKFPMVYLATNWEERPSPCKVVVFSNCEEVELRLNGKKVARQKADNGHDTPYGDYLKGGSPFDGGNCRHLDHPPFTFFNIAWEKGKLEAIGYIDGHEAAKYTVRTPRKPVALRLSVNLRGKPLAADGADTVFVYASVVDANGTVVPEYATPIHLEVRGKGSLVGSSEVTPVAGIASSLVRAGPSAGTIQVIASADSLKPTRLKIRSLPEEQRR